MKKILIFSLNYFPKYVGGAEVAIKEIVERQDKSKYEFHMLTLRFDSNLPKYEVLHRIHIHRIGFTKVNASLSEMRHFPLYFNKYLYQMMAGLYGFYLHRTYSFDAAWSMMPTATGVPMGVLKLLTIGRLKTIVTFQEGDPIPHMVKYVLPAWPLFVYSVRSANVVQTISTFLLNWAKDLGFKNYGVVIPNAVDIARYTQMFSEKEIQEIKNQIGKKDGEIWLIHTGRFVVKNGLEDVLLGLSKLPNQYHFFLVGDGPDKEKYIQLIEELNLTDRVHFYGYVANTELPKFLKACDIFIRPSRSEGMGNSFVEAMSMKMPVIATREGGLSDFIFEDKKKQTAWVCEKDNPDSIVNAVKRIENMKAGNPEEYSRILEDSLEMVKEKYDWEIIAKRMEDEVFSKI
jgi:glycosyltransferase involved in cell wall biosynthesis